MNIWIVDDDRDDCEVVIEAINAVYPHATITLCANGVLLMQKLAKAIGNLPDVIFLDLNMPLKNGVECLDEIKAMPELKHLPIIIHSTVQSPHTMKTLYASGAFAYMSKSTAFADVKQKFAKAIALVTEYGNSWPPKEKYIITAGDEPSQLKN